MERRMTAERLIPRDVVSLLIELPSWVGDAVMATPVLRAARAACPEARITGLMRPGIQEVLAGCPYLDEVLVVDSRGPRGALAAARTIRRLRPDAGLLLPNSFRSALGLRLAGVPVRAGYARDGRGWLLNARVQCDRNRGPVSAVDYYARLGEAVFACDLSDRAVELWVTDEEKSKADRLLSDVDDPFIVLNPGANRPDKRWPVERFADTAGRLRASHGLAIAVTGSPAERSLVDDLCARCGEGTVNLAARGITLGSLKAVLQRAAMLLTNDTGPRHLAAALRIPAVVLYGPTDHRWTTLAGSRVHEHALRAEPFLPENLVADDQRGYCAIDRIPVSDVVFAAGELLAVRST